MTIASTVTDKPYTANGSTTQFAFPNKIFAATDIVVVLTDLLGNLYPFTNFANAPTGLSYTVQGIDIDTGCTVVFSAAPTSGWKVDIRTATPQLQSTSVKNQGQFLPELHEEAFDRATRMLQDLFRQTYTYGIHGLDLETTPWPALPLPAFRKGLALLFDSNGLPTVGVPTTQTLTQALVGALLYPQNQLEINAGVTPTQIWYPYGCPRRFGNANTGNGVQDDTAAVNAAIASTPGATYVGYPGDIYGVQTITFGPGGPIRYEGNGSTIRGIASTQTTCVVKLSANRMTLIDYRVDGNYGAAYLMGTWWYNSTANSQYITMIAPFHNGFGGSQTGSGLTVRAMVYGAPIGATAGFTLGAGPGGGATSANLAAVWGYPTETYTVQFSDGETRACVLTQGSTAFSWTGGLSGAVGTAIAVRSTSFAQSENQIYGWRTSGCQNPFATNHNNGVLQFTDPIFVSLNEGWGAGFSFANARALECFNGILNIKGGELQFASGGGTIAAILNQCFWEAPIIETAYPIQITGDSVRIQGGRYLQDQLVAGFTVAAGTVGVFQASDTYFNRPYNTGSFDNNPLVDASSAGTITFTSGPVSTSTSATLAAAWTQPSGIYNVTFSDNEVRAVTFTQGFTAVSWTGGLTNTVTATASVPFETILSDTQSFEWRWNMTGADVRLVKNSASSIARYRSHRLQITGSDTNIYTINSSPTLNELDTQAFDHLGYTLNGWALLQDFGGGTALSITTSAAPNPAYQASQVQLTAPLGGQQAIAGYYATGTGAGVTNPPTLASQKANLIFVAPGDRFWVSAWATVVAHGSAETINARFYTLAGAVVSDVSVADNGSIPTGSWKFVEGPLAVPATAAYMILGLKAASTGPATGTIQITDLRLQRAN